ncbi:MAG: metal-dependent transcriptional regulator [Christensenellales bacterium]|jgi:DtxR family Mn-dependent transcriptional regulator|nr:metal-dependent transcriptional regulator [Clostridiales bacterium]
MAKLLESGENYLETILRLKKEKGEVRSIDIANSLNYSKASISRAMGIMKRGGYITIDEKGFINFTKKGLERAQSIYERHRIITEYLQTNLNISKETAEKDACRIEHIISQETFDAIKNSLKEN